VTGGLRTRTVAAVTTAVLAVAALAGCGGTAATPAAAVKAGVPAALAFQGRTLDGAAFDAATLAGRPAVLWFWAPWCATCAGQASTVTDAIAQYGNRLGILGIAGLGDNKAMHDFVHDLDTGSVTNLDDSAGAVWRKFKITEQSTFVLLDRQGTVVHSGYLDDVDFNERVKTLVG
jgi:thiol-disulfide isomerase/thioredoxin